MPPEFTLLQIEEAALRAWPAAQQLLYDGWVVRISDGYTKRANSAVLLYPRTDSSSSKLLTRIEAVYRQREMPVVFRLLSFTTPAELDRTLEERGYRRADETLVMTAPLSAANPVDIDLHPLELENGIEAHARMNGLPTEQLPAHRAILDRIPHGLAFFGVSAQHELVACGCAVIDGELAGLFDIVTDPNHRRKGHAHRLVRGMLAAARAQGAQTTYLQVIATNLPAIALYQSLGFTPAYTYRYRILDR